MRFATITCVCFIAISVADGAKQKVGHSGPHDDAPGPNKCTINGIVRNNHGDTVANAQVKIIPGRGGAHSGVSQTRSKPDGTFSIQRHPGVIRVLAQHRGDGRSNFQTNTTENQVLTLEISLKKPGGHNYGGRTARGGKFHLGTHHKK